MSFGKGGSSRSADAAAESSDSITRIGTNSEYQQNLEDFQCSNCQLSVKCRFGKLEFEKAGCHEECFYMKNPFEPPNFHKAQSEYTVDDFIICGSKCFICQQQICIDEECSIFYKNRYCLKCTWRERHSFTDELIAQVSKQRSKAEEAAKT